MLAAITPPRSASVHAFHVEDVSDSSDISRPKFVVDSVSFSSRAWNCGNLDRVLELLFLMFWVRVSVKVR